MKWQITGKNRVIQKRNKLKSLKVIKFKDEKVVRMVRVVMVLRIEGVLISDGQTDRLW